MLIATHSARVASVCDREVEIHGGKLEAASAALESQ
jgi:ABC-type lipoprotein export system ATPase subunit